MTDSEILAGFTSLQQAIAAGFERQNADLRALVMSEIALVRSDLGALEHRMLRRFDEVDARFDRLEERVSNLEAHAVRTDARLAAIESSIVLLNGRMARIETHLGLAGA